MTYLVKSSTRTLDLLELVIEHSNELSLSDISQTLNIPISSMHALVNTLVERGYYIRDPISLRYGIGPKLTLLMAAGNKNVDLISLAEPVFERMRWECDEAISMSVLDGNRIRFIYFSPARSIFQIVNLVGSSLPAHATGSGKVMLAHLPPQELDGLFPSENLPHTTPNMIATKSELLRAIAEASKQGYAIDNQESEPGVWAVASCIRDTDGGPLAAISIIVPTIRLDNEKIAEWTQLVMEGAKEISTKLSCAPVKDTR
jgi:DNA-binding IclR family transcriptional regulator